MRRVVPSCLLAIGLAAVSASADAQDATIKSKTEIKADDAKVVTMTGCVGSEQTIFMLSNAKPKDDDKSRQAAVPVGTSGVLSSYKLTPREGLDLRSHVGHQVEVTGVLVPAATKGDDDAKIEVKDQTSIDVNGQPGQKVESKTKMEVAKGPTAQFAVASLRMISPTCVQ